MTQQPPSDPADVQARRQITRRTASAAMVAGAAGLGALTFYDGEEPVRTRVIPDRTIPDRRVKTPPSTPQMIITRGQDPRKNVEAAISRLGGMDLFVAKGDVVLIKPNIGWARREEQAANTNPHVVAALVESCLKAGAKQVLVTDNPVNDAARCFTRSGITEAVTQAGGKIILPAQTNFHMVKIPGKLGRWPVLEPFITATKIINVPIVKHHSLTQATLGMKNWYGILGGRRNQLHQRINDSVVELAVLMRPTLTVMDATRMLMRNGPTGGSLADVKRGDALAVSLDPVAVDAWAATLLGADPDQLAWLTLGQQKKLGVVDFKSLNLVEITTG